MSGIRVVKHDSAGPARRKPRSQKVSGRFVRKIVVHLGEIVANGKIIAHSIRRHCAEIRHQQSGSERARHVSIVIPISVAGMGIKSNSRRRLRWREMMPANHRSEIGVCAVKRF